MSHYYVVSPEVCLFSGNLYGWSPEPPEYGREVVTVDAPTKRAAKIAGLRLMTTWPREARSDGRNPFAGLEVRDALCVHGFCWCDLPGCDVGHEANGHGDYCEACDAEHRVAPMIGG